MIAVRTPFPARRLASSKGGNIDLAEIFARGHTVVGIVPRARQERLLEAAAARVAHWLLEDFVNVYLIVAAEPAEARALCDRFGIQAPLLSDPSGEYGDGDAGFYLVAPGGTIEAAAAEPENLQFTIDD